MISKGNQRGGGQQLATHLENQYDNDLAKPVEMRGSVANDVHGAFYEWEGQSLATNCREYLYSLSVNPDHRQRDPQHEHYMDYIERSEKALGLVGQPRAIYMHVKDGREHYHAVWSRIDTKRGIAIHISHDRQKLRQVTLEYARDHGLELPDGMKQDRGKDRHEEKRQRENLAENGQEKRTGITKEQRQDSITGAWKESDNSHAFIHALKERGYHLALGTKRSYVVVDMYGEVHSLSRQLQGIKTPALRARLADIPIQSIPTIAAAREAAQRQLQDRQQEEERNTGRKKEAVEAAHREEFEQLQADRRARHDAQAKALKERHDADRAELREAQAVETGQAAGRRGARAPGRVSAFVQRITGFGRIVAGRQQKEDQAREALHKQQGEALDRRHRYERADLARQRRDLASVEKRERLSYEADRRRGTLPKLPRKDQTRQQDLNPNRPPPLHEADRVTVIDPSRAHRQAARPEPERPAGGAPEQPQSARPTPQSAPDFANAASPQKPGRFAAFFSGMRDRFTRTADPEHPAPQPKPDFARAATPPPSPAPPPPTPSAASPAPASAPQPEQSSLKEAFAERAARNQRTQAPDRGPGRSRGPDRAP